MVIFCDEPTSGLDPIRSREHILLSNLLQRAWQAGRDLDLASLIREIQSPPMDKIGVIFCSGYDDAVLTRDFLLDTPGELVQKPYRAGDLLEHVARVLGKRARTDEA